MRGNVPPTLEQLAIWVVNKAPIFRKPLTRLVVNQYAYAAPPRPHPYSMADDGYTSWTGLSDTTYSGRHLPPCSQSYTGALPAADEVLELFMRKRFSPARDTSLLFPFFAQWFTDSFLRTHPGDFRKNQSNHGIDLIQIYGIGREQTRALREGKGGRLASQRINGEEYPVHLFEEGSDGTLQVEERFRELYTPLNFGRVFDGMSDEQRRLALAVGLEHGNSTLGNTLMNTIFLREHNRLAGLLEQEYGWDDDRLFETARLINIALLIKVVIEDYIPHISRIDLPLLALPGMAEKEAWNRPNWMGIEFNLLYRWHGLIPDTFELAGEQHDANAMRNANGLVFDVGIDEIARSASRQPAGRIGLGHTPEMLRPVKQASIALARKAQLRPYNAYRKRFGLQPYSTFDQLTHDRHTADVLQRLYGTVDNVEYLVGLAAEHRDEHDMMGELQLVMVAHDAFTHALTNPILFSGIFNERTFSPVGMGEIERTEGLRHIVVRNSKALHFNEISFNYTRVADRNGQKDGRARQQSDGAATPDNDQVESRRAG